MHVAALIVGLLVADLRSLSLSQDLSQSAIGNLNSELADDAVLTLAVARSVKKNYTLHHGCVALPDVLVLAVVVVTNQVTHVFDRHLSIANHKLLVLLIQDN